MPAEANTDAFSDSPGWRSTTPPNEQYPGVYGRHWRAYFFRRLNDEREDLKLVEDIEESTNCGWPLMLVTASSTVIGSRNSKVRFAPPTVSPSASLGVPANPVSANPWSWPAAPAPISPNSAGACRMNLDPIVKAFGNVPKKFLPPNRLRVSDCS